MLHTYTMRIYIYIERERYRYSIPHHECSRPREQELGSSVSRRHARWGLGKSLFFCKIIR